MNLKIVEVTRRDDGHWVGIFPLQDLLADGWTIACAVALTQSMIVYTLVRSA